MSRPSRVARVGWPIPRRREAAVCFALLALLPLLSDRYTTDLVAMALIYGILAISVDLLWGYAGILNLGPAAAFGLGAYAYAVVARDAGPNATYLGYLLAIGLSVFVVVIVGYVAFRVRTTLIYFALITLAVALTFEKVAIVWYEVTGGSNGIARIPWPRVGIPGLATVTISGSLPYFYFVLLITALVYWFSRRLVDSPFGRVLEGIRENETRLETVGFDTLRYRVLISAISGGIGGLAGALFAPLSGLVFPGLFGVVLSMQAFVWVAVGGAGTLAGPLVAAVGLKLGESVLSGVSKSTYLLIMGVLFVATVAFFPEGVASYVQRWRRDRTRRAASIRKSGEAQVAGHPLSSEG